MTWEALLAQTAWARCDPLQVASPSVFVHCRSDALSWKNESVDKNTDEVFQRNDVLAINRPTYCALMTQDLNLFCWYTIFVVPLLQPFSVLFSVRYMEAARALLFSSLFFLTVTRPDGNSLSHLHWMVSTKAGFYCSRMAYNSLAHSSSRIFVVLPKTCLLIWC